MSLLFKINLPSGLSLSYVLRVCEREKERKREEREKQRERFVEFMNL